MPAFVPFDDARVAVGLHRWFQEAEDLAPRLRTAVASFGRELGGWGVGVSVVAFD